MASSEFHPFPVSRVKEGMMTRHLRRWAVMAVMGSLLAATVSTLPAAQHGDVEAGKQLYQMRCTPCHGADGKANTPTAQALNPKPRDHTDGAYMNTLSNEHLLKVLKNGGAAVGKSPVMPPQADLSDQQIRDVIAYVRTLAVPPYPEKQ